jgi:hypothetical protein
LFICGPKNIGLSGFPDSFQIASQILLRTSFQHFNNPLPRPLLAKDEDNNSERSASRQSVASDPESVDEILLETTENSLDLADFVLAVKKGSLPLPREPL